MGEPLRTRGGDEPDSQSLAEALRAQGRVHDQVGELRLVLVGVDPQLGRPASLAGAGGGR